MKRINILGSTGSIGQSALKLAAQHKDKIEVKALGGGTNINELTKQVLEFKPELVATKTAEGAKELESALSGKHRCTVLHGNQGMEAVGAFAEGDITLSAIVGAAGLQPTLAAIKAGKTIALANKESLVVAGAYFKSEVKKHGVNLLPVDSEHSAIHQCLPSNYNSSHVQKIILTASGGPFFFKPETNFAEVSRDQALAHPNWSMGPKITIDSATLMNKGFEAIEAYWLFDVPVEKLAVVIHPKSIVHSMVEFIDGSIVAQLGVPDMCGPIAYALFYPDRIHGAVERLSLTKIKELHFYEPDHLRFPCLNLAFEALQSGALYPAVLNAANEIAVAAFLNGQIRFDQIAAVNKQALSAYKGNDKGEQLEDYLLVDEWARKEAQEMIRRL